jgi:branched-chain amino acid transport system ATP-binding protein
MTTALDRAAAPGSDGSPVLSVEDLHVRYGGSHVLQGVSFTVPATGVTALLGRNGVGKTTTLKAIIGLAPRSGRIVLQGREIHDEPTTRIIRGGIGYVPEDREVFGGLTVDENLRLVDPDRGVEAPIVGQLFPDLVTRAKQRAGTLSGGQQQMVSLARVLLRDTSVLLIDEPTKGLAPKLVTEVADVLAEVSRTTPILLVEQNLPLVRRIADTVVVLDAGQVVHRGPAEELMADPDLTRELLGVSMRREARQ